MNQPFTDIGFFLEITKDGSPTLRRGQKIVDGESMHHSGGAAAETNYIYKSVLSKAIHCFALERPHAALKTVVVGLGLGYIEISWAQALIESNRQASAWLTLDSFEIISELRERYSNWVDGDENLPIYNQISEKLNPMVEVNKVRKTLQQAYRNGSKLHKDIISPPAGHQWNVICYDAFSQKTDSPLWSYEFLDLFLKQHAASDCVFSTYACTGVLKKVLVENGFYLIKRLGFNSKRDSTIALRGAFMQDLAAFQTF